jgi:hypothetical protein
MIIIHQYIYMNNIVKTVVRHIQIKNKPIAYSPMIYQVIIYKPHPTEYDESDDLEYQKHFSWRPHRVSRRPFKSYRSVWDTRYTNSSWGDATIDME